jgi:hypothetical protein
MKKSILLVSALILGITTHLFSQTSYSIFQPTDTPANPTNNDNSGSITVGVKFRSSQPGNVTAIRFYKGSGTNGSHSGHLFTGTGTLLGSITFSGETSSGWQEMSFTTPIEISANTTYIASCYSDSGYYGFTTLGLSSAVTNGPLTALANGTDGGNGLYDYNIAATSPPTSSYNSSNYWVDIVFEPDTTSGGSEYWSVTGNGGTDSTINFLGTTDAQPLIFKTKDIERARIDTNGLVTIATTYSPDSTDTDLKLAVNGNIYAKKLKVTQNGWPDYVFHHQYSLPSLKEIEEFIQRNKHLPDVPPANEIEKNGLDVGDNQAVLLRKIEELTLYLIELNKKMDKLTEENEILKKKLNISTK